MKFSRDTRAGDVLLPFEDGEFPILEGVDDEKFHLKELRLKDLHRFLCDDPFARNKQEPRMKDLHKDLCHNPFARLRQTVRVNKGGSIRKLLQYDVEHVNGAKSSSAEASEPRGEQNGARGVQLKAGGAESSARVSKEHDSHFHAVAEAQDAKSKECRPSARRKRLRSSKLHDVEHSKIRKASLRGAKSQNLKGAKAKGTGSENVGNSATHFVDVPIQSARVNPLALSCPAVTSTVDDSLVASESSDEQEQLHQLDHRCLDKKSATTKPTCCPPSLADDCHMPQRELPVDLGKRNPSVKPSHLSSKLDGNQRPGRSRTIVNYFEPEGMDSDANADTIAGPSKRRGRMPKWSRRFSKIPTAKETVVETKNLATGRKRRVSSYRDRMVRYRGSLFKSAYRKDPTSDVDLHVGRSEYPSFAAEMKRSNVITCFWLRVPTGFGKTNLPKTDHIVVLEDEQGLNWEANYMVHKSGLSGGWRRFSLDHNLQMGDMLVFELVKPLKFRVIITRVSEGGKAIVVATARHTGRPVQRTSDRVRPHETKVRGRKRELVDDVPHKKSRFCASHQQRDNERPAPKSLLPPLKKSRRLILEEEDEEELLVRGVVSTGNGEAIVGKCMENRDVGYDSEMISLNEENRSLKDGTSMAMTPLHHAWKEEAPSRYFRSRGEDNESVLPSVRPWEIQTMAYDLQQSSDEEDFLAVMVRPKNRRRTLHHVPESCRGDDFKCVTALPPPRFRRLANLAVTKRSVSEIEVKCGAAIENEAKVCAAIKAGKAHVAEEIEVDGFRSMEIAAEGPALKGMTATGASEDMTATVRTSEVMEDKVCASEETAAIGCTSEEVAAHAATPEELTANVCPSEETAAKVYVLKEVAATGCTPEGMAVEDGAPEEMAAEVGASEEMAAEDFSAQEIAAEDFSAQEIVAKDFSVQEMAAEDFAAQELAAEDFSVQEMAVCAAEMVAKDSASDEMAVKDCSADEMAAEVSSSDEMAAEVSSSDEMGAEVSSSDEMAAEVSKETAVTGCASEEVAAKVRASEKMKATGCAPEVAPNDCPSEKTQVEGATSEEMVGGEYASEETAVRDRIAEEVAGRAREEIVAGGGASAEIAGFESEVIASGSASPPRASVSQDTELGCSDVLLKTDKAKSIEMLDNGTTCSHGVCSSNPCTPPRTERGARFAESPSQSPAVRAFSLFSPGRLWPRVFRAQRDYNRTCPQDCCVIHRTSKGGFRMR